MGRLSSPRRVEVIGRRSNGKVALRGLLFSSTLVLTPVWLALLVLLVRNVADAVLPAAWLPPAPPSSPPSPAKHPSAPRWAVEKVHELERELAEERRRRHQATANYHDAQSAEAEARKVLRHRVAGLEAALKRAEAHRNSSSTGENASEVEKKLWRLQAQEVKTKGELSQAHSDAVKLRLQLHGVEDELAKTEGAFQGANATLISQRNRIRDLEARVTSHEQGLMAWLRGVYHQEVLAAALGAVGALGIAGPSSVVRCFLAVAGSAVGSALLASSAGFLAASMSGETDSTGTCWLDAISSLVAGRANVWTYGLAVLGAVLGIVRWLVGFEYALFVVVDEVYSCRPVADVYMRQPLLGRRKEDSEDGESSCESSSGQAPSPDADVLGPLQRPGEVPSGALVCVPPPDLGSDESVISENFGGQVHRARGLRRLRELVQEAYEAAARGKVDWHRPMWEGMDEVVDNEEVDEEIAALLAAHGFRRGRPNDTEMPDVQDMQQLSFALTEAAQGMRAPLTRSETQTLRTAASRSEAAAVAASALLQGGGVASSSRARVEDLSSSGPSLTGWPIPTDIPSATPPLQDHHSPPHHQGGPPQSGTPLSLRRVQSPPAPSCQTTGRPPLTDDRPALKPSMMRNDRSRDLATGASVSSRSSSKASSTRRFGVNRRATRDRDQV